MKFKQTLKLENIPQTRFLKLRTPLLAEKQGKLTGSKSFYLILLLTIHSLLFGLSNSLLAQTLPSTPQPLPPDSPLPEPQLPTPLPPPEELLPTPELVPIKPEGQPHDSETIIVTQFVFEGNTEFTDETLNKLTESYLNRPLTFAELLQVRSVITDYYVSQGYITSGAFIPPQTLKVGVVTIQILEGKVTEINVAGTGRLNPGYVKSRLALRTHQPLNQKRLLEALQLLQLDPLIETISAELSAGVHPGESILNVRYKTAKTFNVQVFANNSRSPSVGSFERGAQVTEASLLGRGDNLSLIYSNTDGSNMIDVIYNFPINARNGTLEFYFNTTDSRIVEPPFDELDITAKGQTYELRYRQPIIQTPNQELAFGLTLARRESDTSILGVGFPLSRGADEEGKTRLSILRLSQEYTQRGAKEVFAARSQFSFGVGLLDATLNSDTPDSQYFAWRGQAQWLRLLAPDTILLLRSDVQLSTQELVPLEQVGLGGIETVRGYRQDALLRDNAIFGSAELRYPIFRTRDRQGILQLTPFVDFGHAWNHESELPLNAETLLSVGLGLRWQYSDRITAEFDWGIPLLNANFGDRTLQEQGLYFQVEWNLF